MPRWLTRLWTLLENAAGTWVSQNAFLHAGALAFYTLFSMAPVVVIVVGVAGLLFGEEAARGELVGHLEAMLGREAAATVEEVVARSRLAEAGLIPTLLATAAVVVGATTVFAQMQTSLNGIWGVTASPRASSAWVLIRSRLLALAVVVAIGGTLLLSLLLGLALEAAASFAPPWLPLPGLAWRLAELVLSGAVITLHFAILFKVLPDVEIFWRHVWAGAVVTAVLFMIGRHLIATYLAYTAPASAYGAAGSLVLTLLWVYYSSLILFFGAALTKATTLAGGGTVVPRHTAAIVRQEIVDQP